MSDFIILTDSSCDLPAKMAEEMELLVLPLTVTVNGKEYVNYLDEREISFHDFYDLVRSGAKSSTSAVNLGAYLKAMEPVLESGKDILCLSFSSGLSNTYNAANLAVTELRTKYPERKIYAVDTLCASLGQGLLIYLANEERKKGKSIEEVRDFTENQKLHLCHWFTVDDLNFLKRGGRVSAATALLGTALNIKPVLHVDNEGRLINMGKVRGRNASLSSLVKHMEETAIDPENQVIFISHGDCLEDAKKVEALIRKKWNVKDVIINYVGPVIGAHSGPGTMALFFLGTER